MRIFEEDKTAIGTTNELKFDVSDERTFWGTERGLTIGCCSGPGVGVWRIAIVERGVGSVISVTSGSAVGDAVGTEPSPPVHAAVRRAKVISRSPKRMHSLLKRFEGRTLRAGRRSSWPC
jgi:hypothetical protein